MSFKTTLLFLILALPVSLMAQDRPEQNCTGALPLCTYYFTQTRGYQGPGTDSHELPDSTCLQSGENNSVWYIFTTDGAGYIDMALTPLASDDDYDFAIFDITGHTCADIITGVAPEVRCNYTLGQGDSTGIGHGGYGTTSGAPGPEFNDSIVVDNTPHTFVLLINNFTSGGSGYTLDFRGSTTGIANTVKPTIVAIDSSSCDNPTSAITIYLSKPVLCDSILTDGSQFTLTGPYPSDTVLPIYTAYSADCYPEGEYTSSIIIVPQSEIITQGNYNLSLHAGSNGSRIVSICESEVNDTSLIYYQKPVLVPLFNIGVLPGCQIDTMLFSNVALPNDSACIWKFGDGTTSTDTNPPPHIYPDTGNYTVTLICFNGICTDSTSETIHVGSHIPVGMQSDTSICNNDSAGITIGVAPINGTIYAWQAAAGITDTTLSQQTVKPQQSTWYYLTYYTMPYGNCPPVTDSFYVLINICDTAGIAQLPATTQRLNIYPNPAQNIATIEWQPVHGPLQLSVTDLLGREVIGASTDGAAGKMLLDISTLADGFYLVKLYTAGGGGMSGKLSVGR